MKTIIKQPIYLAVIGFIITSFIFVSCQDSSITSDNKSPAEPEAAEAVSINPDGFLNPEDIIPNIEDLDLNDFLVKKNSTELMPVESSSGNTSSTGYLITDLGTLSGGVHSYGRGINNSSQATGVSHTSSGNRAFWWENNAMQNIGTLNSKKYQYSHGEDINNQGQVVGSSRVTHYDHAFIWDAASGMQDLGVLSGGYYSFATGVNDQGEVVGYSHTKSGTRGFYWTATDGMQDMGIIKGASNIIPIAINNHGVATGYFYTKSGYRVFTWNATDGFTDLGTLGMNPSGKWPHVIARDINDLGQITGYATNLNGHDQGGFIWDPNTGFQSLGSVPGVPSNSFSYGFGLNNNGQVTGYFYNYNTGYYGYRAFLWDAANGMQDLGVLDENAASYYNYSLGYDINDNGEIIGQSLNKDGQSRAVIWNIGSTNNPPVADAGPDQTLECTGEFTSAVLDGSNSSDPDDDTLTYSWSLNGSEIATGVAPAVELGHGTHTITLTVSDPDGETDSDNVVINVVDTTPPDLAYTVETTELWPANHKMKKVLSGVSIADICDPDPLLVIEVASNEAVNGQADGNTDPDWNIVDNGDGTYDIFARAERSGKGDGRIYTITLTGTDASGNIADVIVEVLVPHNKGNGNGRGR